MRLSDRRLLDGLLPGLALAGLGLAYATTLAPGVTWANDAADSGDLITAAATLGVAHPPGYPTYLLLARLCQLIPLGDLAWRTTLLSALAAALAAAVAARIVRDLLADRSWRAAVAALLAALALGLAPVVWSQAVVAEVYALNALLTAALLRFSLQSSRAAGQPAPPATWADRLRALVAGLALGNHLTIALLVVLWLVAIAAHAPRGTRLRAFRSRLAWVGAGLLVYLYLPLRAAAHPPVNWGDPHDWEGFWWTVSGQAYRELAFGLPPGLLPGRVTAWAGLLVGQFGWAGLALGCFGLLYGTASSRWFIWLSAAAAAAYSAFAIAYNTADSYAYLIPAYLIFAIWIGLGTHRLLGLVEARSRRGAVLVAIGLAGLLAWPIPATARQVDASQDRRAIAFATRVLAAAPHGAIVITASDRDTFPLWYYHYALGQRSDIAVVVAPLLDFAWYRENLRAVYPQLQIPKHPDRPWIETLAALNGGLGRICRTDANSDRVLTCGG